MKNCWIIGASQGIGASLAEKFYLEGYNVILSARDEESLKNVAINFNQERVLIEKLDIAQVSQIEKAQERILKKFAKIDLAIFSPALYQPMPATDFDLELAKKINEINFVGFLNFLNVILPQMTKQGGGKIVAIASVAGYIGLPNSFAYGASKAAMINLCEGIYPELKRKNILLSVVNPGFVKTRLTDKNSFKMPFIISSGEAADEIFKGIAKNKFEIHFPKKFTIILKIIRLLPYRILFFLTSKL
jgi:short-subunit dehydrogenase